MSTAYAIAAVTSILQNTLDQGLTEHGVTASLGVDAEVSAITPDLVAVGTRLNVFMYMVTPNVGWRNECLPSRNVRSDRLTNQPLAIDLHYLVSAHGGSDLFSDVLLGSAMQTLHERPFFDRNAVRNMLPSPILDPFLNALGESGIAEQFEQIKITPEYLSNEDMSKLWSAVQTNYRPSAAYIATVVLIEAEQPSVNPLPVLTRGITARPSLIPPTPLLSALEYNNSQNSAHIGEPVVITGYNLLGTNQDLRTATEVIASGLTINVRLQMLSTEQVVDIPLLATSTHERVSFTLPIAASLLRVGVYSLSIVMNNAVGDNFTQSNHLPLSIAPRYSGFSVVRNPDSTLSVDIVSYPEVHPTQSVAFVIGQSEAFANEIVLAVGDSTSENLSFDFPDLPAGNYWARLRIDGIDSLLIDRSTNPPGFFPSQNVAIPS